MLCDKCHENIASFHNVTIVNGIKKEEHLCSDCAVLEGKIMSSNKLSINDFINFSDTSRNKCPKCNMTLEDIIENGVVGCSNCYQFFHNELQPIIRKIQGKSEHFGKKIENNKEKVQNNIEISEIKNQLDNAIKERRFEDAALLDEKLRLLEGGDK